MITSHKYEGKAKEELLNLCMVELNSNKEELYYVINESEGGLFKGKKVILEAITKEEIINYIKNYLKELAKLMCITITSEIRIKENVINVILVSENNNILIGKDGKTLNSIQLLLRQALSEINKYNLKLLVDASNYKERKVKHLEFEIKKICNEILKTKVEVKLDPMNSYERRIVHSIVSTYNNLESTSVGEAPNRYTIIKYKD